MKTLQKKIKICDKALIVKNAKTLKTTKAFATSKKLNSHIISFHNKKPTIASDIVKNEDGSWLITLISGQTLSLTHDINVEYKTF